MQELKEKIIELDAMKSYPKELFFSGNSTLLTRKKVSIVGSRKPSKYSRALTHQLASQLSKNGVCIVSGGAMGIDAIAHKAAGEANTISVLPCGINIKYPAINKNLLCDIEKQGLLLSQFKKDFKATAWSFVVRNELVVALGDVLIVAEAQLSSGSMRSVEFALKMNKEIFVLPHRVGESSGTNELLKKGLAKAIYDVDEFAAMYLDESIKTEVIIDDFIEFCKLSPSYDEAQKKYPSRIFEAELNGEITIKNGVVFLQ
jgi:DNA processing protein